MEQQEKPHKKKCNEKEMTVQQRERKRKEKNAISLFLSSFGQIGTERGHKQTQMKKKNVAIEKYNN